MTNTIKLSQNQTDDYATNDEFRAAIKRACRADAIALGKQIELQDVDGITLEVFEARRTA